MELQQTFQARFSARFLLLIAETSEARWHFEIRGPVSVNGPLEATEADTAKQEAYSVAVRFFMEKAIAEPRVPKDQIRWVRQP